MLIVTILSFVQLSLAAPQPVPDLTVQQLQGGSSTVQLLQPTVTADELQPATIVLQSGNDATQILQPAVGNAALKYDLK